MKRDKEMLVVLNLLLGDVCKDPYGGDLATLYQPRGVYTHHRNGGLPRSFLSRMAYKVGKHETSRLILRVNGIHKNSYEPLKQHKIEMTGQPRGRRYSRMQERWCIFTSYWIKVVQCTRILPC